MAVCMATKKNGEPCKGKAKEEGLCTFHMPRGVKKAETGEVVVAPVAGAPAKLKGLRRARNLRVGLRAITMLRPICRDGCQDGADVAPDWYLECPHDPYIGIREKRTQVPIYSKPLEDGSRVLERMEERVTWETWPNFSEAMLTMRVNSGKGVERARRRGWILPEEVRSPAYPNGIAPMCQFRSCQWQEGLRNYKWGTFCREIEARMVGLVAVDDATGDLIYGVQEVHNMAKRQGQIERVAV